MAPGIIISIQSALDHLQSCTKKYDIENARGRTKRLREAVIYWLRCIKTFVICSAKLGNNVQLMSLWGRLDDAVRRILDDEFSWDSADSDAARFFENAEPLVEETKIWFITLSDLQQSTDFPVEATSQGIDDILGSVVGNIENFLMCYDEDYEDVGHLMRPIEALREYMLFLRNFIAFASLLCGDQQGEVQIFLTEIEAIAVSAARLAICIVTQWSNIDRMNSINSASQLRTKPFLNPHLCETYSQALASLKKSRECYALTLHEPITVMMNLSSYLLFLLWDMIQSDAASIIPLQSQMETLYDGLRYLRIQLRKLPNMFHDEIRDATRVAICNAGVIIFSIHRKDFEIDCELRDFLGNIKVIQFEFEEKKLNFTGTTVLAFLDSLSDSVKKLTASKAHSSAMSCVPKIREDLAFLILFMEVLMELRKHQEDLYENLWNLGVEVAYKLEFLVDQLVVGSILGSLSPSFLSIVADMRIIKADALKIFDDKRLEKVKDMRMTRMVMSIQSVLDHLNSYGSRFQSTSEGEKATAAVNRRLRCLRTFVICTTKLGINVELYSLWASLHDVACRLLDDKFSRSSSGTFLIGIRPFVEKMDQWFIIVSDCPSQQHTIQVVIHLIGSVLENFEDFLKCYGWQVHLVGPIENLKEYLESSRNFIHFVTLVCADQHKEVQELISQIESLAVSIAHLTLCNFSSEDNGRMESISSALELRIKGSDLYQLYKTHFQALARVKYSRDQLYDPILHCPGFAMVDVISYLEFSLRDMLFLKTFPTITLVSQLEKLLHGLRCLIMFFEKLPSMLDGEIWNIARLAICDAGVIIFSLYHKHDFVIDRGLQDFLGCIEVIQLELENNRSLSFPNSTLLKLVDSSLDRCNKIIHSSSLRREPTVEPDLVFLKSLTKKLVELRKHQEGLHQGLWNLCLKVAYKYKFHIKQMIGHRKHLEYLPLSSLSIAADMNIIKTASFKILHDSTIEANQTGLYHLQSLIRMASHTIESIDSALDDLQSVLNNECSKYDGIVFMMNRIRCLKTFVLCSTKWGDHKYPMREFLSSLDVMVCKILRWDPYWFSYSMDIYDKIMDGYFVNISYPDLQQCSSSSLANLGVDIFGSLSENLEDFLNSPKSSEFKVFEGRIYTLKETITFLTNFVSFANLICADQHQEGRDMFTQIEDFTLSVAHLTVYLFATRQEFSAYRMESIISALELRIRPFQSPQFYAPTLQTKDSPLLVMMDSIDSLLSLLWNMLLSNVAPLVPSHSQLEKLDSGLRTLKVLLRKQPSKLDDKLMDITRLAICHAGQVLSLVDQNGCLIDHSLGEFQCILTKVEELVVDFPRTIMLGFLDFLLEYLKEADSSKFDSHTLTEDLKSLQSLMGKLVELRDQQGDLHQALWNLGAATAYKIEFLIDQLVLGDIADSNSFSTSVQSITEDMAIIKNYSTEVPDASRQEINVQKITWESSDQVPSQSSTPTFNDFVGFIPEQASILNRLMRGSKQLQVIAIVGMPGLGKTTLATKVYNEPSVVDYFHVRARCSISQVFNKRKVLLELLSCIQKKPPNEYDKNTADDLAEVFCRCLKRRPYLIFLDDVWDVKAFDELRIALPDDSTKSRIILTTRHGNVATLDNEPVLLSQFTTEESLELLRSKVFPDRNIWPLEIHELGIEIAEICKGLPLTIVMVVGLLTTSNQELWSTVLYRLRSGIISTSDQCERTIELSYNYLPDQLKPCFLSFAAFPEDHEISVKRLIWMWIAEGFVRKSESKSLEEVATVCLNNLIGRSLVMNAKERSMGGVKSCRIHDLLHEFCLKKANEEFYLHQLQGKEELLSSAEPGNMRRLCILYEPEHLKKSKMYWPRLRSLWFFGMKYGRYGYDMSFLFRIFKLLRVLDMERVNLWFKSPSEIRSLVQLRYLAMQLVDSKVHPAIGNLCNLETLILKLERGSQVRLPATFWNLQKLRHLYSIHGYMELRPGACDTDLLNLDSLSTLGSESWYIMENQLRKFPNIRQLKCRLSGNFAPNTTVSFSFLMHLESLSFSLYAWSPPEYELTFPKTIKKLTLHECKLPWRKIAGIAGLPNLEVLKLLSRSFVGGTWHVEEGEFPKLKVLKLSCLHGIVKWTSSDDQDWNLEKLVLNKCPWLEEIPECLQTVATFELIEVTGCSDRVVRSVKDIEDFQKEMGNSVLQVVVHSSRDSEE